MDGGHVPAGRHGLKNGTPELHNALQNLIRFFQYNNFFACSQGDDGIRRLLNELDQV